KRSSRATTPSRPASRKASTCSSRKCAASASTSNSRRSTTARTKTSGRRRRNNRGSGGFAAAHPFRRRIHPQGNVKNERTDQIHQPDSVARNSKPDSNRNNFAGQNSFLVVRRDQDARDDQLHNVKARALRPVLRTHIQTGKGLRVPVRQVQAHEVQGRR